MFCVNCGNEINDNAVICPHCGVATSNFGAVGKAAEPKKESNVLALVGFILSFFVAIAGLICSIIGYRRSVNNGLDGKGFAIAGIVISAVSLAVSIIWMIIAFSYLGLVFGMLFSIAY